MWAMTAEWFLEPPIKIIFTFSCSWKMNVANYSGIKKVIEYVVETHQKTTLSEMKFHWMRRCWYILSRNVSSFTILKTFLSIAYIQTGINSMITARSHDTSIIIKMWFK